MVICNDDRKKVTIKKGLIMLCMADYNSEAVRDSAIKHTELHHGPNDYNRLKYCWQKLETFPVCWIFSVFFV